jgi:hypothetical protein
VLHERVAESRIGRIGITSSFGRQFGEEAVCGKLEDLLIVVVRETLHAGLQITTNQYSKANYFGKSTAVTHGRHVDAARVNADEIVLALQDSRVYTSVLVDHLRARATYVTDQRMYSFC